jgi:hypothetical protein
MTDILSLIIKAECEGLDSEDEAVELAVAYITTGLIHSTGSAGRFVRDVSEAYPEEFAAALAAAGIEEVAR